MFRAITTMIKEKGAILNGLIHRVGIFAEGPKVVGEDGRAEEAEFTTLIQGAISIQLEVWLNKMRFMLSICSQKLPAALLIILLTFPHLWADTSLGNNSFGIAKNGDGNIGIPVSHHRSFSGPISKQTSHSSLLFSLIVMNRFLYLFFLYSSSLEQILLLDD